jgi:hypothetical protein
MPHEHGKNQHAEEYDYRQQVAQQEAPFLALDSLLDFALELGWRRGDAAPLVAPGIKFVVVSMSHVLSVMVFLPTNPSEIF